MLWLLSQDGLKLHWSFQIQGVPTPNFYVLLLFFSSLLTGLAIMKYNFWYLSARYICNQFWLPLLRARRACTTEASHYITVLVRMSKHSTQVVLIAPVPKVVPKFTFATISVTVRPIIRPHGWGVTQCANTDNSPDGSYFKAFTTARVSLARLVWGFITEEDIWWPVSLARIYSDSCLLYQLLPHKHNFVFTRSAILSSWRHLQLWLPASLPTPCHQPARLKLLHKSLPYIRHTLSLPCFLLYKGTSRWFSFSACHHLSFSVTAIKMQFKGAKVTCNSKVFWWAKEANWQKWLTQKLVSALLSHKKHHVAECTRHSINTHTADKTGCVTS